MSASLVTPAGWRNGAPPIIAQGVLDGDAIVYELFPMQTVVFDGRVSTSQSVPLPVFDTTEYRQGTLSVMLRSKSGFSANSPSQLRLWIQNAVESEDDPALVFASDAASALVDLTTAAPSLQTVTFPVVGAGARLRLAYTQSSSTGAVSATLAVWLTLRRS